MEAAPTKGKVAACPGYTPDEIKKTTNEARQCLDNLCLEVFNVSRAHVVCEQMKEEDAAEFLTAAITLRKQISADLDYVERRMVALCALVEELCGTTRQKLFDDWEKIAVELTKKLKEAKLKKETDNKTSV